MGAGGGDQYSRPAGKECLVEKIGESNDLQTARPEILVRVKCQTQ